MKNSYNRDIIVIGASAGGVEALAEIVAGLPEDLPAAVFVAVHVAATSASRLPDLLADRGPLPAKYALHGETVEPGRIYVAPPDNHLTLRGDRIQVVRGPKENGHRPSVDALFRTASAAFGPRVIGVVLTGHSDCGTAGLLSIKARNGVAIVQSPEDAKAPEMPLSALQHVDVDHVLPLRDLASALNRLARDSASPSPARVPEEILELEGEEPGAPAGVVCPLCQGDLTESKAQDFDWFRCHVGHAFSLASMLTEQQEELERALWAGVRALEESARLAKRMSLRSEGELRARFAEREATLQQYAVLLKELLLNGASTLSTPH